MGVSNERERRLGPKARRVSRRPPNLIRCAPLSSATNRCRSHQHKERRSQHVCTNRQNGASVDGPPAAASTATNRAAAGPRTGPGCRRAYGQPTEAARQGHPLASIEEAAAASQFAVAGPTWPALRNAAECLWAACSTSTLTAAGHPFTTRESGLSLRSTVNESEPKRLSDRAVAVNVSKEGPWLIQIVRTARAPSASR